MHTDNNPEFMERYIRAVQILLGDPVHTPGADVPTGRVLYMAGPAPTREEYEELASASSNSGNSLIYLEFGPSGWEAGPARIVVIKNSLVYADCRLTMGESEDVKASIVPVDTYLKTSFFLSEERRLITGHSRPSRRSFERGCRRASKALQEVAMNSERAVPTSPFVYADPMRMNEALRETLSKPG